MSRGGHQTGRGGYPGVRGGYCEGFHWGFREFINGPSLRRTLLLELAPTEDKVPKKSQTAETVEIK